MKANNKAIAAILMLAFTSQTTILAPQAIAGEPSVSYRQLVGTEQGNTDLIRGELKDYKIRVQSGAMTAQESIEAMSASMLEKNIKLSDIDAYVQANTSAKEYKTFKKSLTAALKGVNPEQMNPQQLSEVLASTMQNSNVEGLAWSGCAGLSIGIILVVSAVVVGIVALTKTKGEARIRRTYSEKRSSRTDTYNRKVFEINNKAQTIQLDINKYQGYITSNNQKMATLNGQISGALQSNPNCSSDPVCSQNVINWNLEIQKLLADNQTYTNKINTLNIELAQWQNPVYVQNQLTLAQTEYQQDMQTYEMQEQSDIALIPANKALAKKLGIGAGIGAAIGTYLIIDGALDGGC